MLLGRLASKLRKVFYRNNHALLHQLEHLLGFTPSQIGFYELAFTHRSSHNQTEENNERLEYLGDAILGAIVAEYLFRKYPAQSEGFLTEMRSRMVRRETLNSVGLRMGLNKMVLSNSGDRGHSRSSHIYGNALEALVGAVYLDKGYDRTRIFIQKQVIKAYMDMDAIEITDNNHKNKLLSWSQRNTRQAAFVTISEKSEGARKLFIIAVTIDGDEVARGSGYSKKEAGQDAAQKALIALQIGDDEDSELV